MISLLGDAYEAAARSLQIRYPTSQRLNFSPLFAETSPIPGRLPSHADSQVSYQSGSGQRFNYLGLDAKSIIRIIAIASSSLSVLTGFVAIYFFRRMEKRYRHK
jgi:hypothetical protein